MKKKREYLTCLFVVKKQQRDTFKATIVPRFQQSHFKNKLKLYQNFNGKVIDTRKENIIVLDEPEWSVVREISNRWKPMHNGKGILIVLTVNDDEGYKRSLEEMGVGEVIDKLTVTKSRIEEANRKWMAKLHMQNPFENGHQDRMGQTKQLDEMDSPLTDHLRNSQYNKTYLVPAKTRKTMKTTPKRKNRLSRLATIPPSKQGKPLAKTLPPLREKTTTTKKKEASNNMKKLVPDTLKPEPMPLIKKRERSVSLTLSNGSTSSTSSNNDKRVFNPISQTEEIPINIFRFTPDSKWHSFDFDAFDYSLEQIRHHILWNIHSLGFDRLFGVKLYKVYNLLICIEALYMDVPYHSIRHAYDVTQYVFCIIHNGQLDTYMPKFDLFCSIITALMHDLNHMGFNNNYLADTEHPLSRTYNDKSPLEQHHCRLAFRVLRMEPCSILESVSPGQYKTFRKHMVEIILATDMINHKVLNKEFEMRFKEKTARELIESEQYTDYDILCMQKLIMKTCDVSNVTRSFTGAEKWAERIISEFCIQGDMQLAKGLPTDQLFNRHKLDFPATQIGFINYVARGQFNCFVLAFPELSLLLDRMDAVEMQWKNIAAEKPQHISQFETTLRKHEADEHHALEALSSTSTEELFHGHELDTNPPLLCKIHFPTQIIRKFKITSSLSLAQFRQRINVAASIEPTDRLFYADADQDWVLIEDDDAFTIAKEESLKQLHGRMTVRMTTKQRF